MKLTFKQTSKLLALPIIALSLAFADDAEAKKKETANVVIHNFTGKDIIGLNLSHKYSDVYKHEYSYDGIIKAGSQTSPKRVEYNTGALTSGKDWWAVNWVDISENPKLYYSNPNNFRNVVDFLEQASTIAVPVAAGIITGVVGAVCTGATAGGCGTPTVIATSAAVKASTLAISQLTNSEGTDGYKQFILRPKDAGKNVVIQLFPAGKISISAPSGSDTTVYDTKAIDVTPAMEKQIKTQLATLGPDLKSVWNSDFGLILFEKNTYGTDLNKTIDGKLQLVDGAWVYAGKYGRKDSSQAGTVIFTFAQDLQSFKGTFIRQDGTSEPWNGVIVK